MSESVTICSITAKETWPLRHRVMWPDMPLDYVKLPNDSDGFHYGLFVDNSLTSVISLFVNDQEAQFRKFATEVSEQGKGYGSQLLKHVLLEARTRNIQRMWCNARLDKTTYYKRFGMVQTDSRFSKGDIDYVIMELVLA